MNDNVLLLISYLIAPVIFLVVGLVQWRFPPSFGSSIGYKTKLSYSSKEAWDFAQVYFGRLCTLMSIPVLAISAAVGVLQVVKNVDENTGLIICLTLTTLQLVPLFVCIFKTEAKLKKYFGGDK